MGRLDICVCMYIGPFLGGYFMKHVPFKGLVLGSCFMKLVPPRNQFGVAFHNFIYKYIGPFYGGGHFGKRFKGCFL